MTSAMFAGFSAMTVQRVTSSTQKAVLAAEGAIPYYLGAGAAFDLLVAAHDVERTRLRDYQHRD